MTAKEAIIILEDLKGVYSKAANSERIEVALAFAIDALVILNISLEEDEYLESSN